MRKIKIYKRIKMSQFIHQPNDKFFKQSMADLRVAREFFATHLPAEILQKADLTTLKLQKNTFIDKAYKGREADVIYTLNLEDTSAYLYVLCEHQSAVDKGIAWRLLVYIVQIIEQHRKQNPREPLPIVYPLVVYSGEKLWDAPLDVIELFGEQQALARELWLRPYQLIDVHRIEDKNLSQHLWSGLIEFVLKYQYVRDFAEYLKILLPWLDKIEQCEGVDLGKNVLHYVVAGIEADDEKIFTEKANEYLTSKLRGESMTLAQLFEKAGFEKGLEQGKTLAQQEKAIIAKKLLADGMPLQKIAQLVDLSPEKISTL